jgi:uncharacterized membrane protein
MTYKSPNSSFAKSRSSTSIYIDGKKYPLSEQVVKNIETVIGFQAKQERTIPIHEKILTKIVSFFGRSIFLYLQLVFFITWGLYSHFAPHLLPWGLPKLDLEQMGVDIASLLIATGVLVQQTRQDKLAEQRSHLNLQINLLTEQKIAKLIDLMEELRTDLPIVRDRHDWEAQMMKEAADPQVVLDILQENLEQSSENQI